MRTSLRTTVPAVLVAALALTLTGCGESADGTPAATPTSTAVAPASESTSTTAAAGLVLADGWAKAIDSLDDEYPMTGVFGILTNSTDADVHLTGGHSAAAGMVELHETVMSDGTMVMRQAADGFRIPAGESLVLEPGANHIMLMQLTTPIPAGEDIAVTVTADDGSEYVFSVPARTFAGAQESYAPGHGAPSS